MNSINHIHTRMYSRYNTRTQHDVFTGETPAFCRKLCRSNCNLKHTDTAIISSSCHREPIYWPLGGLLACGKELRSPYTTLREGCTILPPVRNS